ncbi:hypothetical protein CB1_001512036 [Camelus ferus]|nr:hypothetical protein CB1_001512036 [Camelus ferus]
MDVVSGRRNVVQWLRQETCGWTPDSQPGLQDVLEQVAELCGGSAQVLLSCVSICPANRPALESGPKVQI